MQNKKLISIIILGITLLLLLFFGFNNYVKQRPQIDTPNVSNTSWYNDSTNGIKFLYPTELKTQEGFGGIGVSFWKWNEDKDKCGTGTDTKCIDSFGMFAFDYKAEDGDNLDDAYKRSSFYKDDAKNFVDKKIISVAGEQALLARFCDEWKSGSDCDGGKRSVRDIFIKHNNKLYIFRFGGVGGSFEKGVLDSIVFTK